MILKMEIKKYLIVVSIIITGLLFLGCSKAKASPEMDAFAKCLAAEGAKMYGAYWCPHCVDQKTLFEDSKELPYIECSLPNRGGVTEICKRDNIQTYPTWEFSDGERLTGLITLGKLSAKTGCELQ